ncbi:MAG: hypothetical protein Q4B68_02385, partial [Bacteroidales bacterium]|nr:hypothetical protein [Bacteroidales bacterium]
SFSTVKFFKEIFKKVPSNKSTYKVVLLYGFFFVLSFLAWGFTKSYTTDVEVNLNIVGKPNQITVLDTIPEVVSVPMEGKVFFHLYYKLLRPDANINFLSKFQQSSSKLVITIDDVYASMSLNSLERPVNASKLSSDFPLSFAAITHQGKKVPVRFGSSINLQFNPVMMSLVKWPVCTPDSVTVYAQSELLAAIDSVALMPFSVKDFSDTVMTVGVKTAPGVKYSTTSVRLHLDLEKNYLKRASITVGPKVVRGVKIQYHPAAVDILYYVPQSFYDKKAPKIAVFPDDINLAKKSGKVAVRVAEEFPHRKIYKILTDSVTWTVK